MIALLALFNSGRGRRVKRAERGVEEETLLQFFSFVFLIGATYQPHSL